jgi:hypothetical protein
LWELASNYSVRALTDGVLDESELEDVMGTPALIEVLIRVGLWHGLGHQCERCVQPPTGGIVIHDFLEYNPDASSVGASRDGKAEGGRHGNHVRWHANRGITDPSCDYCAIASPIAKGSLRNPPVPGPVPVPDGLRQDSLTSSPEGNREGLRTDEEESLETLCARQSAALGVDFGKVRLELGKRTGRLPDPTVVMRIIATVLERVKGPVKSPTGVVLTSVRNDWAEWQKFIDKEAA